MPGEVDRSPDTRYEGWKAISGRFGVHEKTVQRWSKSDGLPVRHVKRGQKNFPFIYETEVQAWLKSRESPRAATDPSNDDEHEISHEPLIEGDAHEFTDSDELVLERPDGILAPARDHRPLSSSALPIGGAFAPQAVQATRDVAVLRQLIWRRRLAIALSLIAAAAGLSSWYFLYTREGLTKLGDGGSVCSSEYVAGIGPKTPLNRYLVVEAPSHEKHIQASLTGREWQAAATFGDASTEIGTQFRLFVLVTTATLRNVIVADPLPPESFERFSTLVTLRKKEPCLH